MPMTLRAIGRILPRTRIATKPTSGTKLELSRRFSQEVSSTDGRPESVVTPPRRILDSPLSSEEQPTIHRPSLPGPSMPGPSELQIAGRAKLLELYLSMLSWIVDQNRPTASVPKDKIDSRLLSLQQWQNFLITQRLEHGGDGVWKVFQSIQDQGLLELLAIPDANLLRDGILQAALKRDERISIIVDVALVLKNERGFTWPRIYMEVVRSYLKRNRLDDAFRFHKCLAPILSPGNEAFGSLLSSFLDPSPSTLSALNDLYLNSTNRQLYDQVIPVLFEAGRSKLARSWRSIFIFHQDLPTTMKSRQFLVFLASHYPLVGLKEKELEVIRSWRRDSQSDQDDAPESFVASDDETSSHSDSFMTRLFADMSTSVELAINLVHETGLRVIGPGSLQSLALREPDAQSLASRLAQLKKLDIKVAPQVYCQALVFFALRGENELLWDLVNCDIDRDEFNDENKRRLLLEASAKKYDFKRNKLLQGVERALRRDIGISFRLKVEKLLLNFGEVHGRPSSGHRANGDDASQPFQDVYNGIRYHSRCYPRGSSRSPGSDRSHLTNILTRAIAFVRDLKSNDFALPTKFWRNIFYCLGRSCRLEELSQICLEVVKLYKAPPGFLIPVSGDDWPPPKNGNVKPKNKKGSARQKAEIASSNTPSNDGIPNGTASCFDMDCPDEKDSTDHDPHPDMPNSKSETNADHAKHHRVDYIPVDLAFTHRTHPIQKLFDSKFQRAVVRWGFDQVLATRPISHALLKTSALGIRAYDVACGIRLLALLRDQGVYIDKQILRSAIISRIALAHASSLRRHPSRDRNEIELGYLKQLCEEAWGSQIFSSLTELVKEMKREEPKIWANYPVLLGKEFDKHSRTRR